MKIASISAPGKGDMDLILAALAVRLASRGLRVVGLVQVNTECESGGPCDMDVQVLPDGAVLRISQSLGPGARGCRLDPDALARAVGLVAARLEGADLLIINKFGKQEAAGGGFRDVIADALGTGLPVIVGLNALNAAAFEAFSGGLAEALPPDIDVLEAWAVAQAAKRPAA
ncbi:MAG: DUF2478 domain-containing protein [Pseudomonadota bacterium]